MLTRAGMQQAPWECTQWARGRCTQPWCCPVSNIPLAEARGGAARVAAIETSRMRPREPSLFAQ